MSASTSTAVAGRGLWIAVFGLAATLLLLPCQSARAGGLAGGEYFVGPDPGAGNGTLLVAADGAFDTETELVQTALEVAGLSSGVTRVGLRFKGLDGSWGNATYLDVKVEDAAGLTTDPPLIAHGGGAALLRTVAAGDYSVDGGTHTALAAADGAFDSVVEQSLAVALDAMSLSKGVRRVAMRFQDSGAQWGNETFVDVLVQDVGLLTTDPPLVAQGGGAAVLRTVAAGDYSVDGGAPTALVAADGAFDSVAEQSLAVALDAMSLSNGVRRVAMRFQDSGAQWGNETFVDLLVQDAGLLTTDPPLIAQGGGATVLRTLAAGDYAVDGGTRTALVAADGAFDSVAEQSLAVALDAMNLSNGVRRVAMRFQDNAAQWGNETFVDVVVQDSRLLTTDPPLIAEGGGAAALHTLAAAEMFVDNDPGAGYGTALPAADGAFDDVAELLQKAAQDVSQLAGGPHQVGLRFKESTGAWGNALYQGFSVFSTAPEAPSIAVQPPARQIQPPGGQAVFNVLANGSAPLSFQWFKEGLGISGATNSCYLVYDITIGDAGEYAVVITNDFGSVTSSVSKLIVRGATYAPEIVVQPVSQTVLVGTHVALNTAVEASWPVWFQWYKGGLPVPAATATNLVFTNAQLADSGIYWLVATNDFGGVTSAPVALNVDAVMAFVGDVPLLGTNTFEGGVIVRLETTFDNGTIFYTLDGNVPDYDATPYSGSFLVTRSCRLRAAAYNETFAEVDEMVPASIVILPLLTFSATTAGGGTVTLDLPGGAYLRNTVVTASAVPASGWTFMGWMVDSLSTDPSLVYTMTNSHVLQAVFGTSLSTLVTGNGAVMADPQAALYPYGTTVRLSAVPTAGNYFVTWGSGGSGTENPLNFIVINPNPTVTCLFAPLPSNQYALTVVPQGFGRVSLSPRANRFAQGQSVTLTATPDAGQLFLGWAGDLGGTNNRAVVTMNSSLVIEALFTSRPSLQPDPENANVATEGFRLLLKSEFGARVAITSSSNLADWAPWLTVTNNFGTLRIFDDTSVNMPWRFYRAVSE